MRRQISGEKAKKGKIGASYGRRGELGQPVHMRKLLERHEMGLTADDLSRCV